MGSERKVVAKQSPTPKRGRVGVVLGGSRGVGDSRPLRGKRRAGLHAIKKTKQKQKMREKVVFCEEAGVAEVRLRAAWALLLQTSCDVPKLQGGIADRPRLDFAGGPQAKSA